jgi:polysaccharide deacetylase 2 family uncharacterized protein YibQ
MARSKSPNPRATRNRKPAKSHAKKSGPLVFLSKFTQQILSTHLNRILLGGVAIFAIGMVLGVAFVVNFTGDAPEASKSPIAEQREGQSLDNRADRGPDQLHYRVPVQVVKEQPQERLKAPAVPKNTKTKNLVKEVKKSKPKQQQARSTVGTKPRKPKPQKPVLAPKPTRKVTPKKTAKKSTNRGTQNGANAPWRKYAVLTPRIGRRPAISIVLDDLGIDQRRTGAAIAMPAPLTLAFIPYGYNLRTHTARAHASGHELLVHIPMEPLNAAADPGKNALLTTLTKKQLRSRLEWNLTRFQGYVGINNHMGSKFTAWGPGMKIVLQTLKNRGLLFLDSKTNKDTRGYHLAKSLTVPHAVRDVFIDHVISEESITRQLKLLEKIARETGGAIGIGHPHDATIAALKIWIPAAKKRGIVFVPISALVKRKFLSG